MTAFGAPAEFIEQVQSESREEAFAVFEDNWQFLQMFLRLQTQWVVIQGGFVGLNYQSADVLIRIYGVKDAPEMMDALQVMEAAALPVLNERSK